MRPKTAILSGEVRKVLSEVDPEDAQGRSYAQVIGRRLVEAATTESGGNPACRQ